MHLTLHSLRALPGAPTATLHVAGDVLTINGDPIDLSGIPEGGEGRFEGESLFVGSIRRIDGAIHATLQVPLGDDAAPEQDGPWVIADASGVVVIPYAKREVEHDGTWIIEEADDDVAVPHVEREAEE